MGAPRPARVEMLHGDSLHVLATLDAESIDAVVCDPPYGLAFMGKKWDYDVPGADLWRAVLRVLKPGGHLLAFGGTRTYHRMVCAIEDAGFEIRDQLAWVYGSGFPKSLDVSKAIDKAAGIWRGRAGKPKEGDEKLRMGQHYERTPKGPASTVDAAKWQGWGTALKPAIEPIVLARKPFAGTVARNVQQHGTGALNIDGCRVPAESGSPGAAYRAAGKVPGSCKPGEYGDGHSIKNRISATRWLEQRPGEELGRWPANLIHDGSDEVLEVFPDTAVGRSGGVRNTAFGLINDDGCQPRPTALVGHDDQGGSAARLFYCAKASRADRDDGLDEFSAQHRPNGNKWTDRDYRMESGERKESASYGVRRNHHPTVKPTDLMRYLCRLITPPGGVVLDPFMGSGSPGRGAVLEGFGFIGIEREADYLEVARARIAAAQSQPQLDLEPAPASAPDQPAWPGGEQLDLLG